MKNIKNFKNFINESLLDKMIGKSDDEIRNSLSKLGVINRMKKIKDNGLDISFMPTDSEIIDELGEEELEAIKISHSFKPYVVKYIDDNIDGYSVLIGDKNSDITLWMDVYINGGDIICEWNQYIFDNSSIDIIKRKLQDDSDIYEESRDISIQKLEEENKIKYTDDRYGVWSYVK